MNDDFKILSPQERNDKTHCAVTATGKVINIGDTITDFRGEAWRFLGITRLPNGASSGHVYVQNVKASNAMSEFFPSVFDLTIELKSSFTS